MQFIIVGTMRITLAALILLGIGFLVLSGLLSIIRELFADDHHHPQPHFAESDIRRSDSVTLQGSVQPKRRYSL